ncbi:uncharacterized protein LOC123272898 [Cotesia glomerata]|uniref:uncharacterized protein LOC123272898 n=1 Tax=Cotesia glomerata TaxID=32391 RepID=UPI001D01EBC8|nr:uncharacterized protein LOC123272898 [Cotesia glomerata]
MKLEEISKQKDILHQISQASDAIRRKHKMLKLGKDTAEKAMEEMFKPIVTPLQSIVESSKLKKENIKKEEENQQVENQHVEKQEIKKSLYDDPEVYNSLMTDDESSFNNTALDIVSPLSTSTPKPKNPLLTNYLQRLSLKHKNNVMRYEVRRKHGEIYMGDSNISFANDTITVKERNYPITHGLLELLFTKTPKDTLVTQDDKTKYLETIQRTNTHRKSYDSSKSIYIDSTNKYKKYIADFVEKLGRGLPKFMITTKTPMDYVYWDDPNELVDRLRLLMASQAAGNPSHTNEIMSIIEELREAGVIY